MTKVSAVNILKMKFKMNKPLTDSTKKLKIFNLWSFVE